MPVIVNGYIFFFPFNFVKPHRGVTIGRAINRPDSNYYIPFKTLWTQTCICENCRKTKLYDNSVVKNNNSPVINSSSNAYEKKSLHYGYLFLFFFSFLIFCTNSL